MSAWKVVRLQLLLGLLVAAAVSLLSRFGYWSGLGEGGLGAHGNAGGSALYGAAVVVIPAALMARGMTSRVTRMSPAVSALGFLGWSVVKMAVSLGMLALAPRLVPHLNWPALLVALVLCIKVYWLALLQRRSSKN